jgi:hypothetical protein
VAVYLRREATRLDAEPVESLIAGRLRFGSAPLPQGGPE